MKKIPTLFIREFDEKGRKTGILNKVTPGMECVLNDEGIATIKIDGTCTCIKEGVFYKRYDCKRGKTPPAGFIPCCNPDPITGHWPGWIRVEKNNPGDKWLVAAYENTEDHSDGTYEVIGPHFQKNPYHLEKDIMEKHGIKIVEVDRTFEGIRKYLEEHNIEGIVFWKDGEPLCKIKRSDFGFPWNK